MSEIFGERIVGSVFTNKETWRELIGLNYISSLCNHDTASEHGLCIIKMISEVSLYFVMFRSHNTPALSNFSAIRMVRSHCTISLYPQFKLVFDFGHMNY